MIQLNTMTKKTSLFEKEVAFLQTYQIGKHVAKLIPAILNKYISLVSMKSITVVIQYPERLTKIDEICLIRNNAKKWKYTLIEFDLETLLKG